jgi:hypothetical protein
MREILPWKILFPVVCWHVVWYKFTDILGVTATSIIILLVKEEAKFSEASVCIQQFGHRNITEGRNRHGARKYVCDALRSTLGEGYDLRKLENK